MNSLWRTPLPTGSGTCSSVPTAMFSDWTLTRRALPLRVVLDSVVSVGMRRLVVVAVVALVALLGLPLRTAMSEMTTTTIVGSGKSVEVRCTIECSSMPPASMCLTRCLAGAALLSAVAAVRRSQPASRLSVPSSLFFTQLTGSSLFRPPRST